MKTPITYYGGKQNMLKFILPLIPQHNLYCEPFVGGGALFFAKAKSNIEVINDLNGHVVNFYKVCATEFEVLRILIQQTPHSRQMHRESEFVLKNPEAFSSIKRAWAFWVQTNMTFASKMFAGYAYEKLSNKTQLRTFNKKLGFNKNIFYRLSFTDIECNDALKVIKSRDTEDSFFYLDPPYYNSNCGHYKGYSLDDFVELLELLSNLKGKFLLSSYPSDSLKKYTTNHNWFTLEFNKKVAVSSKTDKQKTEVLTSNYPISLNT